MPWPNKRTDGTAKGLTRQTPLQAHSRCLEPFTANGLLGQLILSRDSGGEKPREICGTSGADEQVRESGQIGRTHAGEQIPTDERCAERSSSRNCQRMTQAR